MTDPRKRPQSAPFCCFSIWIWVLSGKRTYMDEARRVIRQVLYSEVPNKRTCTSCYLIRILISQFKRQFEVNFKVIWGHVLNRICTYIRYFKSMYVCTFHPISNGSKNEEARKHLHKIRVATKNKLTWIAGKNIFYSLVWLKSQFCLSLSNEWEKIGLTCESYEAFRLCRNGRKVLLFESSSVVKPWLKDFTYKFK